MSKLSSLIGKSQTFTIGGETFEIKPRTMKDIDLIMELTNQETQASAMKKLIRLTLQESVPDATDDEIDQVAFKYFKELSEAIVKVNGLADGTRSN